MRILHTSDWHLGQSFYGKSRAREHQQFLQWLLSQVTAQRIDAIIVAGDIFDTGTPPSYAREMYFDFVVQLNQINCQLIILAGNHDSVAMLSESKTLLQQLNTYVIPNVCDDITLQVFPLINDKNKPVAIICAVPFIRPRDVMQSKAGQSAKEIQQSLQQNISKHYQTLFDRALELSTELSEVAGKENAKPLPIIATGHLTTVGVTTSESVRDIYIGTLDAFPANAFPAFDYIALGHIHRHQKVANTEHIRYCGSPIPLSFDEANQDKTVLLVSFPPGEAVNVEPIIVPRFQAMLMVKSSLDGLYETVKFSVNKCRATKKENETIWLDIEMQSAEYLQDLHLKIDEIIAELPVEVLLVRRAKQSRMKMNNQHEKITLNELSLADVFTARLAQSFLDTPDDEEKNSEHAVSKKNLTALFLQMAEEVNSTDSEEPK